MNNLLDLNYLSR